MSSNLAVWKATNSIHGERLAAIAAEHMQLVKVAIGQPDSVDLEIVQDRIDALRAERDEIIELFEEGENDD